MIRVAILFKDEEGTYFCDPYELVRRNGEPCWKIILDYEYKTSIFNMACNIRDLSKIKKLTDELGLPLLDGITPNLSNTFYIDYELVPLESSLNGEKL